MDVLSILALIGGVAVFLFGMHIMSSGLEKVSGNKLENRLKKLTSNKFKSLAMGAGITVAMQSSSALTVMLIGLVNSGIMVLEQTVGIIMGSNVGTTLTGWLLSLTGIKSDNLALQLARPENFAPVLALIGVLMLLGSKDKKKKNLGMVLCGFAILMISMELMSNAVEPIAQSEQFAGLLTAFSVPIIGVIIGAVFTGIIQSSAASLGILQALSLTGSITYSMAIPVVMGLNIGTCVTAVLSSIGVNRNAKRVSVIHICFNLIGTAVLMSLYYGLDAVFHFPMTDMKVDPVGIALIHTIFNVATTAILLPFSDKLVSLAKIIIKDKKDEDDVTTMLDDILLKTPSVAVSESANVTYKMADKAKGSVDKAVSLINSFDAKVFAKLTHDESKLDEYEDFLGSYLVKVAACEISADDSTTVTKLMHVIGDFEHTGDNAYAIGMTLEEMNDKEIIFSDQTKHELKVIASALSDITELTVRVFKENDLALAAHVEPLEQVIDDLAARIKKRHIKRLKTGECTADKGIYLTDLLTHIKRISDYCSNVAVCVIQIASSTFETHSYLHSIKYTNQPEFLSDFDSYKNKYSID
ncbi:MAG: Na/Pi cotransporter family protein [Christensenellaceae bacterium]|nr:Na/Pi cotransporter family protein [Christensenellaceae bacterium]